MIYLKNNDIKCEKRNDMSSFILKLIAIVSMACDHIGAKIFPSELWLRAIGRITMPIMAYQAATGYRKTKNVPKYLLRLGIFALVSEPFYYLLFEHHSNVIITIFLGVASLYTADLIEKVSKKNWCRIFSYAIFAYIAHLLQSDWSFTGVFLIIAFYHANGDKLKNLLYPLPVYAVYMMTFLGKGESYFQLNLVQLFGLCALPLICLTNGKKGPNAKYLFYIFYPLHMVLIYILLQI